MVRRRRTVLVAALLAVAPHAVFAAQHDQGFDSKFAFIATTAFLTLFPLGLALGAFLWLRRRVRQMEAEDQAEGGDAYP